MRETTFKTIRVWQRFAICVALLCFTKLGICQIDRDTPEGIAEQTANQAVQFIPQRLEFKRMVDSELKYDAHSSLSPSGESRLVRASSSSPATWMLERAGRSYSLSTNITRLHGKQPVGWRFDELAVVLQGKKETVVGGNTRVEVGFAVLDFKSRAVVEIDPAEYELLPAWSRNGKWVFGLRADDKKKIIFLDPTKNPISESERPVIQLEEDQNLQPWLSAGGKGQGVIRLNVKTFKRDRIKGGEFRQYVEDQSADGRYCLTSDDGVSHGEGDGTTAPWNVFDYVKRACTALPQPPGMTGTVGDAQISDDGKCVVALWREKGDDVLGCIAVRADAKPGDWLKLHQWKPTDPDRPLGFVIDGQLRWKGGKNGWLMTRDGLLQLRFADK